MNDKITKIADGMYPIYVREGKAYPVALTEEQKTMFTMLMASMSKGEPFRVVFSKPLGEVYNVVDDVIKEREGNGK